MAREFMFDYSCGCLFVWYESVPDVSPRRFLKHIWLIFQIENMNKCMK